MNTLINELVKMRDFYARHAEYEQKLADRCSHKKSREQIINAASYNSGRAAGIQEVIILIMEAPDVSQS